jgi:secondary thiamine-phosphate synthase enzyme
VQSRTITVATGGRPAVVDLTSACATFIREVAPDADGLLNVYVPHATAGVVVMELGAGSDEDLLEALGTLLPRDDRWRHRHGHRGHGADHVLPLMVAPSMTIPVLAGRLALGTWQAVAIVDTNVDNASRTVRLSFLPG